MHYDIRPRPSDWTIWEKYFINTFGKRLRNNKAYDRNSPLALTENYEHEEKK